MKVIRARHERWATLHASEARDSSWAREEEMTFIKELESHAGRAGNKILGVDCRTTSCAAELE
jgi:hypothetical protein